MKKIAILMACTLMLGMFAGCAPSGEANSPPPVIDADEGGEAVNLASLIDVYKGVYTPEDLSAEPLFSVTDFDAFSAYRSAMSDTIINSEGSYRITDQNNKIVIDAPDAVVQLILDGAILLDGISATCKKLVVTVETDSEIGGTSPIYTSGDLVLNGGGKLTIVAETPDWENGDFRMATGVSADGDITLVGIALELTATTSALSASGGVNIHSGSYAITTDSVAVSAVGDVHIDGGSLSVLSGYNGVSGENVYVTDGVIDITVTGSGIVANGELRGFVGSFAAGEGELRDFGEAGELSEMPEIQDFTDIAGDEVSGAEEQEVTPPDAAIMPASEVTPPDAAIMPSSEATTPDAAIIPSSEATPPDAAIMPPAEIFADIRIVGGIITINAEYEGLGSNGSIYIDGGEVYASVRADGGGAALSYAGQALVTGGTAILVGGQSGAMGFGTESTQYSFLVNLPGQAKGGTLLNVVDGSNNAMAKTMPAFDYQSVVVSTPKLADGGVYTLVAGTLTARVTISQMSEGSDSWTAGGRSGGHFGGRPGIGGIGAVRGMIGEMRPGETRSMKGPNGEDIVITGGENGSIGFSMQGGGANFSGDIAGGVGEFFIGEAGGGGGIGGGFAPAEVIVNAAPAQGGPSVTVTAKDGGDSR